MDFDVFRLVYLVVRIHTHVRESTLTGPSTVGLDAASNTTFDSTVIAGKVRVIGVIVDRRIRTERTVD